MEKNLILCMLLFAFSTAFRNEKPSINNMIEIYAHRAGRGLAPENTLHACETALRLGVDYIDLDIGMTQDGVLMVVHDVFLDPKTMRDQQGQFVTKTTPIYKLSSKELQLLNVGKINPASKYAAFFPMQTSLEKAAIPTLEQAIEHVLSIAEKKVGFQIEIKMHHFQSELSAPVESIVHALYAILKKYDIIDQTEIQAFKWECLDALQTIDHQIKTSYLTPPLELYPNPNWDSIPAQIKELGGSCWCPFEMDLTQEQLEKAHDLGLKVVTWGFPEHEGTEFNHPQILKLIKWGIDGIITDRPDTLRSILAAHGHNVPSGLHLLP